MFGILGLKSPFEVITPIFIIFFFNKVVVSHISGFSFVSRVFVIILFQRGVVSFRYIVLFFIFFMRNLFVCRRFKWAKHVQSKKTNQIMVVKYVDFESIHYVINLDIVSSFRVFNEFDYVFLSIYC